MLKCMDRCRRDMHGETRLTVMQSALWKQTDGDAFNKSSRISLYINVITQEEI